MREKRNKWKSANVSQTSICTGYLALSHRNTPVALLAGDKGLEMTINWQSNDDQFCAISSDKAFTSCVITVSNELGFENLKAGSFEIFRCPPLSSSSPRVWLIRALKQRKQELPFLQRHCGMGTCVDTDSPQHPQRKVRKAIISILLLI